MPIIVKFVNSSFDYMDNTTKALRQNRTEAFDSLYRAYAPRLYRFAYSIIRSDADAQDVLQTTFLRIWEGRSSLDPSKNISSYLYAIARNLCIDMLRHRLYAQLLPVEHMECSHNEVINQILGNDGAAYIQAVVDALPARRREIFLLSRVSNMTYRQIAEHLNISENTVDTQMKRALSFLREKLTKEQFICICLLVLA